jgi:hypothetical protein
MAATFTLLTTERDSAEVYLFRYWDMRNIWHGNVDTSKIRQNLSYISGYDFAQEITEANQ